MKVVLTLESTLQVVQSPEAQICARNSTLCFICQKNSHGVRITWLKGYFIVTKHEDARAQQSWGGNFRTPCMIWTAYSLQSYKKV